MNIIVFNSHLMGVILISGCVVQCPRWCSTNYNYSLFIEVDMSLKKSEESMLNKVVCRDQYWFLMYFWGDIVFIHSTLQSQMFARATPYSFMVWFMVYSTIFLLYCLRKPEYAEKTTDLPQVTDNSFQGSH